MGEVEDAITARVGLADTHVIQVRRDGDRLAAQCRILFIALLVGAQAVPVTWTVPNEPTAIRRLVRKLEREAPGPVRACYEAGPCGYALQRQRTTARVACQVIAPALIPRKPGERVKTNARDARKLAELHRAGLLTDGAAADAGRGSGPRCVSGAG